VANHVVGISDLVLSNSPEDIIVTYSLGSCVGMSLYDPVQKVGALIHCMLPLSKIDKVKAKETPAMFVDTGISVMLQKIFSMGATKKNIIACVAGAASILDEKGIFKIGERNITVLRKMLWKNNIMIAAQETGGSKSRTMKLYLNDGRTTVTSKGMEIDLV